MKVYNRKAKKLNTVIESDHFCLSRECPEWFTKKLIEWRDQNNIIPDIQASIIGFNEDYRQQTIYRDIFSAFSQKLCGNIDNIRFKFDQDNFELCFSTNGKDEKVFISKDTLKILENGVLTIKIPYKGLNTINNIQI
ncbi:MAG: hypothetical protein Q4G05_04250 [Clostridia bacterium]|nr:hypothetical protein [Clostridia bacterium]